MSDTSNSLNSLALGISIIWSNSVRMGYPVAKANQSVHVSVCTLYMYVCVFKQGSYRSGKTGKSRGIWVVKERSGKKIFWKKSGKMKNWCHQMSDFQAKVHQIWFPMGLHPRPRWGSLQHSPDPLAALNNAPQMICSIAIIKYKGVVYHF